MKRKQQWRFLTLFLGVGGPPSKFSQKNYRRYVGAFLSVSMPTPRFPITLNPVQRILQGKNSKPSASLIGVWILLFPNLLATICFQSPQRVSLKHFYPGFIATLSGRGSVLILSHPIYFATLSTSSPINLVENCTWCSFYFSKMSPLMFKL